MNESDIQDIRTDCHRIDEILATGIFERKNIRNPLMQSAFVELIIHLRDLMAKCRNEGVPVEFSDDILLQGDISDVWDAVSAMRDAVCHITSHRRHFDSYGNRGIFFCHGKGVITDTPECRLESEYDDDLAVFYGRIRLYMNRNIVRAYEEAKAALDPLIAAHEQAFLDSLGSG